MTDPAELGDQRVNLPALAALSVLCWCGAGCLIFLVSTHRRNSADVAWQRKRQARASALKRLNEARRELAAGQPTSALRLVRSALAGLVADLRNLVAEGLTASEIEAILTASEVSPDERAEVARLLESIESAAYGPGIALDATAMVARAERLIPSLARRLERGS